MKIRIQCPVCGAILEAEDNPSNYGKNVTCPNCKTRSPFPSFQRILTPTPVPADCTTEIRRTNEEFLGHLLDPASGKEYPLQIGHNLIGRMTFNVPPKASVPIVTDNLRMSRAHLNIDVIIGADGHFHTYTSNASNKNPTTINGFLLEDKDTLSLKDQDVLSLAGTQLVYLGGRVHDETEIL